MYPSALDGKELTFGDTTWTIIGSDSSHTSLWNEASKTLISGIDVFNEIHLFLADINTVPEIMSWFGRIKELDRLQPTVVIPSHADINKSFDKNALEFTENYLITSADTLSNGELTNSDFEAIILHQFPDLLNVGVLNLSSKIVTKEIPWGE